MIPRYFTVAERDHELQNPTSEEKLRLLGERLRLGPGSRVLDIASGRGGPALAARARVRLPHRGDRDRARVPRRCGRASGGGGLAELVSFRARRRLAGRARGGGVRRRDVPRRELRLGQPRGDARRARAGGAAGRPRRRRRAVLAAAAASRRLRGRGRARTRRSRARSRSSSRGRSRSSRSSPRREDDWDRYETLHWRAVEEWLAENPDDPDAADIRARHERYKRDVPPVRPRATSGGRSSSAGRAELARWRIRIFRPSRPTSTTRTSASSRCARRCCARWVPRG